MIEYLKTVELELTAPPFFKKWKSIYLIVTAYQMVVLAILYLLSNSFK
jgi:hypothetical protein